MTKFQETFTCPRFENKPKRRRSVSFQPASDLLEFDPCASTKSIHEPGFMGEEHDEKPWYEEESKDGYDDIMRECNELYEEDELTIICKNVMSGDINESIHKIQCNVLTFILKLQNRVELKKALRKAIITKDNLEGHRHSNDKNNSQLFVEKSTKGEEKKQRKEDDIAVLRKKNYEIDDSDLPDIVRYGQKQFGRNSGKRFCSKPRVRISRRHSMTSYIERTQGSQNLFSSLPNMSCSSEDNKPRFPLRDSKEFFKTLSMWENRTN